jgi:hypothetical protein
MVGEKQNKNKQSIFLAYLKTSEKFGYSCHKIVLGTLMQGGIDVYFHNYQI